MNIGPYDLGQTLGTGTYGKVKLSKYTVTDTEVAIKMIRRGVSAEDNSSVEVKLQREINIQRNFHHPHIIRLFEVINTGTHTFLVMEHANGGELFECISHQGRLHETTARRLFQQLVCAVEYCHERGVAHRDLKPENILLHNSDLKIADFGLSNTMKDGEFLRTSCGSPNYAAPEVIAGQLYSGAGADIWSIGVILYAMLVGHLPFDEESLPVLFRRITEGKYSIPSTVSASAADLISRILVVDVISRATMQVIKSHPWFLDGFPAYLAINPEDLPEFDEDTVAAVADKLRTTHDDVREKIRQLSSGNEDVVCGSDDADVPQHTAWIAYNVMLDTKAVYMKYAMTHCMDIPTLLTTSNTPELVSMESEICRSYPLGSSFLTRCNVVGESSPESSQLEACSTWSVGLPAGRGPADCMRHIFLVLQYRVTDVEWRILAPFQLALRSTSSYKGCVVGLQLFKMRPSIAGTLPPSCIVDFFVMGGSIMVAADFIIYLVQACRELNFPRTPAYSRSTQLAT